MQFVGHWAQGHRGLALALWPAEMRGQNQPAALFDQQLQGGQGFNDARRIGDDHFAIFFFQRHVVIHAHKNAFAFDVQVANSEFSHKLNCWCLPCKQGPSIYQSLPASKVK